MQAPFIRGYDIEMRIWTIETFRWWVRAFKKMLLEYKAEGRRGFIKTHFLDLPDYVHEVKFKFFDAYILDRVKAGDPLGHSDFIPIDVWLEFMDKCESLVTVKFYGDSEETIKDIKAKIEKYTDLLDYFSNKQEILQQKEVANE